MYMRKSFFIWLALILVPTFLLWHYHWPYIPLAQMGWHNIPYSIAIVWAMWYLHENFGWFLTRSSDSDSPRMRLHPQNDPS